MSYDFNRVLDALSTVILDFDLNSFISKDTVSPKAQHVSTSAFFNRSNQDMDVKFDMTIR